MGVLLHKTKWHASLPCSSPFISHTSTQNQQNKLQWIFGIPNPGWGSYQAHCLWARYNNGSQVTGSLVPCWLAENFSVGCSLTFSNGYESCLRCVVQQSCHQCKYWPSRLRPTTQSQILLLTVCQMWLLLQSCHASLTTSPLPQNISHTISRAQDS